MELSERCEIELFLDSMGRGNNVVGKVVVGVKINCTDLKVLELVLAIRYEQHEIFIV